jgi:uncharacterized membrane protein
MSMTRDALHRISRALANAQIDLLICLVLPLLFWLVIELTLLPPSIRLLLGSGFVLVLPGYIASLALFPARVDLDPGERATLSLMFSVVIVSMLLFMLNYTYWGIGLDSIFLTTAGFNLITGIVAWIRRGRLTLAERFVSRFHLECFRWTEIKGVNKSEKCLYLLVACSMLIAAGTIICLAVKPRVGERFTEFYVIGPSSEIGEYPRDVIANEPIILVVAVSNQEHVDVQYRVEIERDIGTELLASPFLRHGETWEQHCVFTLTHAGRDRQIRLLLYKGNDEQPYRSLHLWINVREKASGP